MIGDRGSEVHDKGGVSWEERGLKREGVWRRK